MNSILEFIISPLDCATFVGGYDSDASETYSEEEYVAETPTPLVSFKGRGESDRYKVLNVYTWKKNEPKKTENIAERIERVRNNLLNKFFDDYEKNKAKFEAREKPGIFGRIKNAIFAGDESSSSSEEDYDALFGGAKEDGDLDIWEDLGISL